MGKGAGSGHFLMIYEGGEVDDVILEQITYLYFCPALTKLSLDLHVKKSVSVCLSVCMSFRSFSVTNFLGFY